MRWYVSWNGCVDRPPICNPVMHAQDARIMKWVMQGAAAPPPDDAPEDVMAKPPIGFGIPKMPSMLPGRCGSKTSCRAFFV